MRRGVGGVAAAVGCALLAQATPAAAQDPTAARDAALGAPLGTSIGTPINEAEVRDASLGAPRPVDRAPFTPMARSELGRAGQGVDGLRPVPPTLGRGLRLGNGIALSPFYRGGVFYDSNVFRAPAELAVDDIELTNALGIDLAIIRPALTLEVGYVANHRAFLENSDITALEHRARLSFAAVGPVVSGRLRADVAWLERPDDPRFARGSVKRTIYDLGGVLSIGLTRTIALQPEAFANYQEFRTERMAFADNASYGGNLLVALSPRAPVTVLAGVGYRELNYTHDDAVAPDLRIFSLIGGVELHLLRTLTGQARVGYDWSEVTERRNYPAEADPPSGLTAAVNLRWEALRTTALSLEILRQIDFGTTTSPVFLTRATLGVEQALPLRLGLAVRASYEEIDAVAGLRDRITGYMLAGGIGWSPRPWVQVGVQGSHLIREGGGGTRGDFDVTRIGVMLTLRY